MLIAAVLSGPIQSAAQITVSFSTTDGGTVYAHQYGTGNHAVLLAHGGQFAKESWKQQAVALKRAGFKVLAIDFRGRGKSRGGSEGESNDEATPLDVAAALNYLHDTGAGRISVVGASFGGWAAAEALTRHSVPKIDRLVLLAHSPIENPEALPGRKLFIMAREDFRGSGTLRLPDMQDQYDRAPEPKRFLILDGSAHAQHLFGSEQGPKLLQTILDFLVET